MKRYYCILFTFLLPAFILGQQTINGTITHDGINREYILYVPANYDGSTAFPVVFNFHGYTSNANAQMSYGDFRPIADTADFLVVHPQGTLLNGITHWNVGGWTIGSTTDDVGFTSALIDSLADKYNIDLQRVYATGMSNGGFMSFLLACQMGDKIAAIASVTGSMTPETFNECKPNHPTPIMQIHGTSDPVVPYNGAIWSKKVTDAIDYWVDYNNCDNTPTVTPVPDVNTTDGSTAEHMVYPNGRRGATVEHYKVTGGGHTWPGAVFGGASTNKDFDASLEVWRFFARYDLDGLTGTTATTNKDEGDMARFYPNPVRDELIIEASSETEFAILGASGNVLSTNRISGRKKIDLSTFEDGMYYLRLGSTTHKVVVIH